MRRFVYRAAQASLVAGVVVATLVVGPASSADVPTVINYQARLTDNTPQQNPIDGSVAIDFRLYGSAVGNDLLWSENWPSVPVVSGILNILLGSNGSPLDKALFSGGLDRHLEVEIEGEILAPRQRIGSTAYAFHAGDASDLDIACADGQLLKYSAGAWTCSDPTTCPVGTMVECYDGPVGTLNVGECSVGSATCNGAGYSMCVGATMPIGEVCNNLDDDCNGLTDETFPGIGGPCTNGIGACEVAGGLICPSGSVVCDAIPLNPTAETCNDIDDDCNGPVDDGLAGDVYEPNESCGVVAQLPTLGSNDQYTINTTTLYPAGDYDYFRVNAIEDDSTCGCGFGDEDYRFHAILDVPSTAGSYEVCVSTTCGSFTNCTVVTAGNSGSNVLTLDGDCAGSADSYSTYIRIRGINSPAFECLPYSLTLWFEAGLCL